MSESRSVPPLRIAVLGDFEGVHTRRWLEVFVQRGHEVHAISYYRPDADLPGVTLHVLNDPTSVTKAQAASTGMTGPHFPRGANRPASLVRRVIPPTLQRLIHARRYLRAGLRRVLDEIQPDVFHAHYAVEHGFYGAFAGFHPYVVSAWGSDLLVESRKPFGRLIARHALGHADLVTANDVSLARRAAELGVPEDRIEVVHLGIDRLFLDAGERSVNLRAPGDEPPTIISSRALERLYNVDIVLRAFAQVRERVPGARLIVASTGSRRSELAALSGRLDLGASVQFVGQQSPQRLAELMAAAHVYVSVPSSDSLALSTVEAMAAGCFPVVSDLPSNEGWIEHRLNGFVVPPRDDGTLASALVEALTDGVLRRDAVAPNRAKVAADGLRERNMLLMERHFYRLAGHPQAGAGESI